MNIAERTALAALNLQSEVGTLRARIRALVAEREEARRLVTEAGLVQPDEGEPLGEADIRYIVEFLVDALESEQEIRTTLVAERDRYREAIERAPCPSGAALVHEGRCFLCDTEWADCWKRDALGTEDAG